MKVVVNMFMVEFWIGCFFFFFQAEDGIRDIGVTGVQTCALPILQKPLNPSNILSLFLENARFI